MRLTGARERDQAPSDRVFAKASMHQGFSALRERKDARMWEIKPKEGRNNSGRTCGVARCIWWYKICQVEQGVTNRGTHYVYRQYYVHMRSNANLVPERHQKTQSYEAIGRYYTSRILRGSSQRIRSISAFTLI